MSISTVTVIVPAQGLGPAADISSIIGQKTVQLSGTFEGYYDLLGTQDDSSYVAVASFNAGGPEGVKVVLDGSIKSVKLRASVTSASGVTCSASGTLGAGENKFGTIASLAAGSSGLTPVVDTSAFIPPTGSEVDTCFLCSGDFEGAIAVLGSADGLEFNPVGEFRVARRPEGSPTAVELAPLQVAAKLRYYRLLVSATVSGPVTVTMGGRVPVSGGSSGTPAQIFVSDGSGASAYQLLGTLVGNPLGAFSIAGGFGSASPGANAVAFGSGAQAVGASSIAVGPGAQAVGNNSIAMGPGATAAQASSIVLGPGSTANGANTIVLGTGSQVAGSDAVVAGLGNTVLNNANDIVVVGRGNVVGPTGLVTDVFLVGSSCQIRASATVCLGLTNQVYAAQSSAMGNLLEIDAGATSSVLIGHNSAVRGGALQSVVIGYLSSVSINNAQSVVVGPQNSVGGTGPRSLAVGFGNTVQSPDSLAIGRQHLLTAAGGYVTAVGQNITVAAQDHVVAVGQNLTIGNPGLVDSFALGRDITVLAASVGIGKTITVAAAAPQSVSVGFAIDQQGLGSVCVGQTLQNLASTSTLVGNNLHNTATSDFSVLIGKDVDSRGPGCVAIGTNINVGLTAECTDGVAVGPGAFIGGNAVPADYAVALGGGAHAQANRCIALGKDAKVDYTHDDSQAYGMRALTTQAGEVIFASATNPVTLFHARGTAALDLLKFELAAAANALDSAMYLLHRDAGGTLVLKQVKLSTAPSVGSLYLYITP